MLKRILFFIIALAPLTAFAQEVQPYFGYLSYGEVFTAMPEYSEAQDSLQSLKLKFEKEMKRADDEFNRKYAEFLQDQKSFPDAILRRRQKELQLLMERSIAFKDEIKALLAQAQEEMTAPVTARLQAAIKTVADAKGLHYVLNTDQNSYPYINPIISIDITDEVKQLLGITVTE